MRSLTRSVAGAALVLVVAAGCSAEPPSPPPAPPTATPEAAPSAPVTPGTVLNPGEPRELVTGMEVPWGIAFLPDGSALVTQRIPATISRVDPDGRVTELGRVEGVTPTGEGGLLGIALSPGYATDRTVFVMFTTSDDNRVVKIVADPDGTIDGSRGNQQEVVTGITKGGNHDGGRLAFGPDGYLYITAGEAGRGDPAQDRDDLGGKILRVTADGAPAPGNPFGTPVYTLGHRNPQGLAWDPSGRLYAAEFGQNNLDEINLLQPGGNYGWPEVEGQEGRDGFLDPVAQQPVRNASWSGLTYAGGSLYVGALRGERLFRYPVNADGSLGEPQVLFEDVYGRIRTVATTPDGRAIWFTTSNRDGRGDPRDGDDRIIVLPLSRAQHHPFTVSP
ncbi:PQQ-dependent sugar dehydrogenase [Pseudonocardia oroxyli]|uniref:PQQ-dependent sugar dehydrogenase n=1 Tax=Pseudonocardia oroxyli TaxID=366584 RepID=UPI001FE072E6|nr:PQQ-dependent sugar dehydrogenase [Pseudonocardia oroxyli]